MTTKVKTMDLQGKQYAQVKDRLKEFREKHPNGLIETAPTVQPDGVVIFKARILTDKSDETSAEATGHALGKSGGVKQFEKLETIAVGRALALLGYGTDGEIASSEEMEEFEKFKADREVKELVAATKKLKATKNLDELRKVFVDLPADMKEALESLKDELKNKYVNA